MCGEQCPPIRRLVTYGGSPPRVRGTAERKLVALERKRITPACAGNSPGSPPPRSSGGSPPRVRGTERQDVLLHAKPRITPACAGNRAALRCLLFVDRDHPRVCGEQNRANANPWIKRGSPPRVRGTAHPIAIMPVVIGITPACAGNSQIPISASSLPKDHPRVCGEQEHGRAICKSGVGSPPRVRGTVRAHNRCAGVPGSPPRVRGTAPLFKGVKEAVGITPACAGNRLKKARHFYILFCQIKRIHLV